MAILQKIQRVSNTQRLLIRVVKRVLNPRFDLKRTYRVKRLPGRNR